MQGLLGVFQRNPFTGELTYVGGLRDGIDGAEGLNRVDAIAASPGGRHLYTVSSRGLGVFARDAPSGLVSFVALLDAFQVRGGAALIVSPDGNNVYVANPTRGSLVNLSRDASAGSVDVLEELSGLNGATDVEVSRDSHFVYVASAQDDAIASFSRDAATGTLTALPIITGAANGLTSVASIALSPDDRHLYAASSDGQAVFSRDAQTGALNFERLTPAGTGGVPLGPAHVTVSPDGTGAFVIGSQEDTLAHFVRDGSNALPQAHNVFVAAGTALLARDFGNVAPQVAVVATDPDAAEVNLDPGSFTISHDGPTHAELTVHYTVSGTATGGDDYDDAPFTSTAVIPADASSTTINLTPINDDDAELDETVVVSISADAGYEINPANQSATVTIVSEDLPSLTISDVSRIEADGGLTAFDFTVSLSLKSPVPVSVDFATRNSTALAGSDYQATNGTLTIAPNTLSDTITVQLVGDGAAELDEHFFIDLDNPSSVVILDNEARGTVLNEDFPTLSISDATMNEGDSGLPEMDFTVTLSQTSPFPVSVAFVTRNGSAIAGNDYRAANGTLVVPANAPTGTIKVQLMGDLDSEFHETFFVDLSNASQATIVDSTVLGTIRNDDRPVITILATDPDAAEVGLDPGSFTVFRTGSNDTALEVFFAVGGKAERGDDYQTLGTIVSIPAGASSASIRLDPLDDQAVEPNETVTTTLAPDSSYVVGDPSAATVNIASEDVRIQIASFGGPDGTTE